MYPVYDIFWLCFVSFQQAITPHGQEVIGNHYQKSPSRKTLIALVTSGLLLAFLGLTAYFLMKRRSWSPMGERLVSAYSWQNK